MNLMQVVAPVAVMVGLSQNGLNLIKHFEGLRLESYVDSVGVLTIGYGHTGPSVTKNLQITEEQANDLLENDVTRYASTVKNLAKVPLNQCEYDALVSFTYNVGTEAFRNSTLLRLLNEGRTKKEVASEFARWVNDGKGNVLPGLVRRREAEKKLFLSKPEKHPLLGQSILCKHDTWLKKRPVDSSLLKPEEKLFVQKGSAWEWTSITMTAGEKHKEVRLLQNPLSTWYFYDPHWKIINDLPPELFSKKKIEVRLSVPYFSQRDNKIAPNRTCFSSSSAMLLKGLMPEAINSDDDYIETGFLLGDTTEAWVQIKALEEFGLHAEFRQDGGWDDIEALLREGVPVPLGILNSGPVDNPSGSGHWITAVGITKDGESIIVHDPLGRLDLVEGVYRSDDGEYVEYSKTHLGPRWMLERGYSSGWYIKAKP